MAARLGNVLFWTGNVIAGLCLLMLAWLALRTVLGMGMRPHILLIAAAVYLLPIAAVSFFTGKLCRHLLAREKATGWTEGLVRLWFLVSVLAWAYLIWSSEAGCHIAKFFQIAPPNAFCKFPIADPLEHYVLLGLRLVLVPVAVGAAIAGVAWTFKGFKRQL